MNMEARKTEFQAVIDQHWAGIYQLCLRMTGSVADAEEAAQQCFYLAFRAWNNFAGRSSVKTWLYRIAINACRDLWSKRPPTQANLPEGEYRAGTPLEDSEKAQAVQRALLSLAPKHQLVLTLFCLQDMSHRDIAEILECPEGTAWSRLHHAREALEAALRKQYPVLWE